MCLPGHASFWRDKMSKHELQTRTGVGQPRAGTGMLFDEHGLQKPSPQPRQWCLWRPVRSKLVLHAWQCWKRRDRMNYGRGGSLFIALQWFQHFVASKMVQFCLQSNYQRISMVVIRCCIRFLTNSSHRRRPFGPNAWGHRRSRMRPSRRARFRDWGEKEYMSQNAIVADIDGYKQSYRTAQSSGALFPYQYCRDRWISPQLGQSITEPLHANLANPIQDASLLVCVVIRTTTLRPFRWHFLHRYTLFSYWFWYRQHFELWWSLRLPMWPMDSSQRSSHDIHWMKHVKYCSGNGLNVFSLILPENFRFSACKMDSKVD